MLSSPERLLHAPCGSSIRRRWAAFYTASVKTSTSWMLRSFLLTLGQIVGVFVVIGYSMPLFLAVLALVLIAFRVLLVYKYYLPKSRQLRRLESVTRSPVFSHVAETIQGTYLQLVAQLITPVPRNSVLVRPFDQQCSAICALGRVTIQATDLFIAKQAHLMDKNHEYNLALFIANRFLGVCIDLANNVLVGAACAFAVYAHDNAMPLGAGNAALSPAYS